MPHTIQRRHLAAAIHTAAVNDLRFYLNGIRVEGRVMVATDGCCLSAYLGPECPEYLPPFVIPLEVAKRVVKRKAETFEVRAVEGSPDWLELGGEAFRPLESGGYPDWRRVLARAGDLGAGEQVVDPALLVKFSAIAKALGYAGYMPVLYRTGGGSYAALRVAIAGVESEFYGLLLPIHTPPKGHPACGEWLKA